MGISKPTPSKDTTRSRHGNNYTASTSTIAPVSRRTRRGRNKYKPSISFGIGKRRNRGATDIDVSEALKNVRSAIEPSNQKIQADNNYRNIIVCRSGSRLLDQQRSNGRLPDEQQQHRENNNGKREIVNDDQYQSTTEVARKKRRVGFNEESNDGSMPIENLVSTSTPSRTSNKHKRKATPYKSGANKGNFDDDDDDDGDHDEEMNGASKPIPTIASRDLVKAKRPASKSASKKSDSDDDDDDEDKEEDFTIMPDMKDILFGEYKNWSTSDEREKLGEPIVGDFTAPDCFMLKPPVSLADTPRYILIPRLSQFRQMPLADRTDRTVLDEDDDIQETWKCDAGGFANADDETHCQFVKVEPNEQKNQMEEKCTGGRKVNKPLGWGNTKFSASIKQQQDRIKCTSCGVFNEKSSLKCASCEVDIPTNGTESSTRN